VTHGLVSPPGRQGPGELPAGALAALDLAIARRSGGVLPGEHRGSGTDSGTELEQLRPYEPGDDPRHLDPSASARTGIPHVRRHVPERALTSWVVVDVSPSMAFGTGDRLKSDVAEGVATVMSHLAVRRGGRVAMLTAGSAGPRLLEPRGGRGAVAAARRHARAGVAPDATPGGSLGSVLARIRRLARSRGLVMVVSDFRDDGWERPLRALAARHATVAVEITDPFEAALPDCGLVVMTDPETGEQVEADTSSAALRRAYAQAEAARRDGVATALRRAGAQHVVLSTEGDWLRDLARRLR
jgi:uncharacterized protein (DUF58 family)